MKTIAFNPAFLFLIASQFLTPIQAAVTQTAGNASPEQKQSYAIGADLARNLKRQGVRLQTEALLRGMQDVLAGTTLSMSDEEIRDTLRALQVEMKRKQLELSRHPAFVAQENREKGAAFLAQNKTNADVVCLPSGLQYKILKTGTGPKPAETNSVKCEFRGMSIDGEQFCGTEPGGKPSEFQMQKVIAGWKEALQRMPVGSKWKLYIPPSLAYGEQGMSSSRIGPNMTLIYELELVSIN